MPPRIYEFGDFKLDLRERQLVSGDREIRLRAKVFDTLCVLVRNAGRLVRKDELMKAVWPDSVVEENNLEHNLSVLRKTLGENGAGGRWIETVPRYGYRFTGDVCALGQVEAILPAMESSGSEIVVGREPEMLQLQQALEKAKQGRRQIVFLSGEAGIGKSTLLRKFVGGMQDDGSVSIGVGQCLEKRSSGEAYMPLLEVFTQLCRKPDGRVYVDVLRRRAPSWLFHISSVITSDERVALQRSILGLRKERILREGADALSGMTEHRCLILVLEDLHWSDDSTLDFLAHIAHDERPAQLLVIGTYRHAEGNDGPRAIVPLAQELNLRGVCTAIPLRLLSEEGVSNLLRLRLNGPFAPDLARILHQRTEGSPLFVHALVNAWVDEGFLYQEGERWILAASKGNAGLQEPENLRNMIEQIVDGRSPEEKEVVEAAGVAGAEFCASAVAAALNRNVSAVELVCAALARDGRILGNAGYTEWPDGTVCEKYRFVHSLYREVAYKRLPAGLRTRWHVRIGKRLERGFAGHEESVVTELALHFQLGRKARPAIHYLQRAASRSMERCAAPEAVFHLVAALKMLPRITGKQERLLQETEVYAKLAPALAASTGFADAETEAAFLRSYELVRNVGGEERRFPVIFGFAVMLEVRGQYRKAQELLERYLPHEERSRGYVVEGLDLLACSRFHQGAFADALRHAEQGLSIYCPETHSSLLASLGENPGIDCGAWVSLVQWFLGNPTRSFMEAERVARLSSEPPYAYSRPSTWAKRTMLHQLRREPDKTQLWAKRTMQLSKEQGSPYFASVGKVMEGWTRVESGDVAAGIEELTEGIAGCFAVGVLIDRPYHLALLTEAYMRAGDVRGAQAALDNAFEGVERSGSFFYEAELWRLRGLLQSVKVPDAAGAMECFELALKKARLQEARSLELRAAVSLARACRAAGEPARAMEILSAAFVPYRDTSDLRDVHEARIELAALQESSARGLRMA